MALSERERQIIEHGKQTGKTREQALAALAKFREDNKQTPRTKTEAGIMATIRDIPSDIREIGTGIAEDITTGVETAEEARDQVTTGDISPEAGTVKTIGGGLRAGASAIGRTIVGAGKTLLSPQQEEQIGDVVEESARLVMKTDVAQTLSKRFDDLSPEHKAVVEGTLGIAEGAGTLIGAGPAAQTARQGLRASGSFSKEVLESTIATAGNVTDRVTPSTAKVLLGRAPVETRDQAVEQMTDAFEKSFFGKKSILDNLEKQSQKLSRQMGESVDEKNLVRELIEEGGVKFRIEEDTARFRPVIDDFEQRQNALVESMQPVLERVPESTPLDSLKSSARRTMRNSPQVGAELDKSLRELDRFFESLENRFGSNLTASQVNQIRVQMNSKTGAFRGEKFTQDTEDAIADAARARIDEVAPSVTEANREWGKLQRLKRVAGTLNNQKVDIGVIGSTIGSYIAASALGASGFSTGSASLVIAGLAAGLGGRVFANYLRRLRFNDPLREMILQGVRSDEQVVKNLIDEASEADKEFLERVLLKPPEETPIPQPAARQGGSGVRAVPAQRGVPGRDPETGRFFRTFRSDAND